MSSLKLKIQKLSENAVIPKYASKGSACFDLHACIEGGSSIHTQVSPAAPAKFGTGLAFEVPDNHVMLVFSRSGHGFKNDIRLSNCTGVIDSDYRGEVCVKLTNDSPSGQAFEVNDGDRIAQAMVVPVHMVTFEVVSELSSTERGESGFGSTGSK